MSAKDSSLYKENQSEPLRETQGTPDSRAGEVGEPKPFEFQKIMSQYKMSDIDLYYWTLVLLRCGFDGFVWFGLVLLQEFLSANNVTCFYSAGTSH